MLTYKDFYEYLSKRFGLDPYAVIDKALRYGGLDVRNVKDLMNSEIRINDDGILNFKDKIEISRILIQRENTIAEEKTDVARLIFVNIKSSEFLKPDTNSKSYSYAKDAYPVVRELTGVMNTAQNFRERISENFNPELSRIFNSFVERNVDVLEKRGSGYSKVVLLLSGDKVDVNGREVTIFGFVDPMNFEKEKRYNLNEMLCNPLHDVMLRAIDSKIKQLSNDINDKSKVDAVRARMLLHLSILYAFRAALYYQVNPKEVTVLKWNNEIDITLYDLLKISSDLESKLTRNGVHNLRDKRYAKSVKLPELVFEKTVNGVTKRVTINSAELLAVLTGCKVCVQEEYVTKDGKKYFIGYLEFPNGENGKSAGMDEKIETLRLGSALSLPIERVVQKAGYKNADIVAKLTLELIGHHGVVHPIFKSLIALVDGLIKEVDGKKQIDTNTERAIVEYAYIMGEVDSVRKAIEEKLNNLKPNEEHLRPELEKLKSELDNIGPALKIKAAPAKKMYEILLRGRKAHAITLKLLNALYVVNSAAYEVFKNPKGQLKNAFLLEVKAGSIIRLSMSFLEALIKQSPGTFIAMVEDENTRNAVGVLLSAVVLILFSIDMTYLFEKRYGKLGEELEKKSDRYDRVLLYVAYVLVGIGLFLSVFGAPFYMGKDLVYAIGDRIGELFGGTAKWVWNTVAGFEIPLTGQTLFEIAVELPLSGLAVSTGELLVSALYQAVKIIVEEALMNWITEFAIDFICTVPLFF